MEYIPFTPEQVEQANHVDLEEFLLQHGEKLLRSGPEKRLASNRSVTIRGNEWFDHADRQGGQAVSFVQRYLDVPFQEAMQILLGEQGVVYSPAQEKKEEPPKPFVLPPAHTDNRRMRAYLEHTRKISGEVLTIFEKEGLIYEDSLYHNAVFVGLDDQGVARHAHKRSTNTQGKQFKINVEGCNARHSFHWTGSSHRIYVFEAPIDMLSFISMKPDWQQHSYVALCGVAEHALLQQLEAHEQLSDVVLCLDNDDAGIQARKRIKDILQKRGHSQVSSLLPSSKDWNEDLQRGVVMTEKVREYLTLSRETTVAMTQDQEKWQAFLRTAGQMYKYSFNDQVLIFAQRPEATACAGYDVWNKTMRRYVKKGAKGIALLDAQDKHLKLHYIFDVADTSEWKNSRQVYVWQMKDTQLPAVQQALAGAFGVPVNLGSLQEQMTGIVSILWMNRWTQQKDDILDNIDQSFKKEYDEFTIQEMFRKAVVPSVVGAVCSRCGVQAPTISAEEFENISEFKTPKMVNALGNMVTEFSNEALRVVERTVKRLEKDERSKQHGDPVQTSGRGSDPRPGADGHEHYTHPAVGTDAPGVSDGTQVMHLLNHGDGADPVSPPAGDRPGSTGENGHSDAEAGEGGGSHGGAEEKGSDEVGGPDEHLQGSSGGDYPGGTDLQLSLFPTAVEQIQRIEEAERVADTFSAFPFALNDRGSRQEEPLPIPFVEGYAALKAQHYEAVVGVEVGKYVIFLGEDAQIAAKALGTKILSVDIPGMGITDMTGSNLGWPSVLKRLMEQNLSIVLAQQDPEGGPEAPYEIIKERYTGEYNLCTNEEYAQDELVPGETTVEMDGRTFQVSKLELDIGRVEPISVVQDHLEFKPALQKTLDEVLDEHPISIQVNGEWKTFPNVRAAEEASYEEYKLNVRRNARNFHITDDRLVELDMELNMENKQPEDQSKQSSRTGQKSVKERHGTARKKPGADIKNLPQALKKVTIYDNVNRNDKEVPMSNIYSLRLYDTELMRFSMEVRGLSGLVAEILYINEASEALLPLDMERTGEGIVRWLSRRVIPKNRTFVDEILKMLGLSHNDTKGIIDVCKGLSLNDSYWVVPEGFEGTFSQYNLYENRFSEILSLVAYTGAGGSRQAFTTSPELTTGGMLPKAWRFVEGDGIYLYKGGTTGASNAGREPYCEYYASQIAQTMRLNAVQYDLENWKGITASKCALFTDIDTAFIPIGHIVRTGGIAACLEYYSKLGAGYAEQLRSMLVFDALVYNEDRHFGNFGVLRDNHSGRIIAPAPIFDNGLSLFCYAGKDDYAHLDEYAKTRANPYNVSYEEVCAEVMGVKQKEQLRRMIGFKFQRHPSLNLPEEHLVAIEKHLESRVSRLLAIPTRHVERGKER